MSILSRHNHVRPASVGLVFVLLSRFEFVFFVLLLANLCFVVSLCYAAIGESRELLINTCLLTCRFRFHYIAFVIVYLFFFDVLCFPVHGFVMYLSCVLFV